MGIVDYVSDRGEVDPYLDAFHNWPAFFILTSMVTNLAGLESPAVFALWAPVFLNLLYLGPLLMIVRTATSDRRLIWLAVWLFYMGNWIGQDYLSPQGFNYFLYLTIIGILLNWFQPDHAEETALTRLMRRNRFLARIGQSIERRFADTQPLSAAPRPGRQAALMAIVILLFVAVVPSHQLTPFATIAATGALVLFGRITPRGLPLLMIVVTGTWISYMTVPFLAGHVDDVLSAVGDLSGNVDDNFLNRVRGSAQHVQIVYIRLGMALFFWLLAFAGWLRRHREGIGDLPLMLLAGVPFFLLGLQTYGGELLLRVYLFSLPFMAFFVACIFYPTPIRGRTWATPLLIGILCLILGVGFLYSRYGNERMDYFTPQEVEAVERLYAIAEPGSLLVAGTQTLPWRHKNYNEFGYQSIERYVRNNDVPGVIAAMNNPNFKDAYLILTRSQHASAELFTGWPLGTWEAFVASVYGSGAFEVVYQNEDATILHLRDVSRVGRDG
jgi:hypothetical protein